LAKRFLASGLLDDAKQQLALLWSYRHLVHLSTSIAKVVWGLRQEGLAKIREQSQSYRGGLWDIAELQQFATLVDHPSRPIVRLITKPLIGLPFHY
jgi:hypothetical protein